MPVGAPTPQQQAAAALAPILRIAPRTMVTRIDTAHTLSQLPRTAAMAWAGDLEPYRVSVITRAARGSNRSGWASSRPGCITGTSGSCPARG